MLHSEVANEIADLNTAFLLLAQKLLRRHKASGMLQVGASEEMADFVLGLGPAQIRSMSSSSALLCGFRHGNVMPSVFASDHDEYLRKAHLFIVLAARHDETSAELQEEFPA